MFFLKRSPGTFRVKKQELCIGGEGARIYGRLLLPKGAEGPLPTVICCHGLNSNFRAAEYLIGEALAKNGFAAYCFDFRGGSPHSRSQGAPADMSVFTEREDLERVIAHIREFPETDKRRLFLFGESQGGFVSAITANDCPDLFRAMVLYYPAFCIPEDARNRYPNAEAIPQNTGKKGNMMGRAYHEKLFDYDVYQHIANFSKPVMIIHGDRDTVVKLPYVRRAAELYADARLHILPGQGHGFSPAGVRQAAKLVCGFLKEQVEVSL